MTLEDIKSRLSAHLPQNNLELKSRLGSSFLFCSEALPQFPLVELNSRNSQALSKGRIPSYLIQHTLEQQKKVNQTHKNQIMKATEGDHLVSLLELRPFQKLRILKNFNSFSRRT